MDWDDKAARQALVDSRARDGSALLAALAGRERLSEPVAQAMQLLATVLGQDLETDTDGLLRIARKGRRGPGDLDRRPAVPARA